MREFDRPLPKVRRFGVWRLVEHHLNALAFVVLVVTGMAQRFHDASWALWLVGGVGGIDNLRLVHRSTGVVFSLLIVVHVAIAIYGLLVRGWPPVIVINLKDFRDTLQNMRYYFGLTDHPARCDRYDYKQKFEYWGVVLGGILMIATGWMLWFPTKIYLLLPFLPGELIPAAKVAHSNEALMAMLIIVIWHIYNSVFSPEVFPLDTTIVSGTISMERMHHEHPLELERIARGEGVVPQPPEVVEAARIVLETMDAAPEGAPGDGDVSSPSTDGDGERGS